jgi:hypothetical protein
VDAALTDAYLVVLRHSNKRAVRSWRSLTLHKRMRAGDYVYELGAQRVDGL